jgi:hypothetical protein
MFFKIMRCLCIFLLACFVILPAIASPNKDWKQVSNDPNFIHRSLKEITDVIVHDIYSPPVASRIYAYVTIAGYEAARPADTLFRSLSGQLKDFQLNSKPEAGKGYSYSLAAVHAMLSVGKALVISEQRIETFHAKLLQEYKRAGVPEDVFKNSVAYGKSVASEILAWADKDNYRQTRSLEKYLVDDDDRTWKPTPPAYMKAVEPHWSKLRPFLLDSCQQFAPPPPAAFSTDTNSLFHAQARQVRDIGLKLTNQQREIADFWDCNPFKMNIRGHVLFATKKISPGGHWMNITRLACKKAKADFIRSAEAYACVAIGIADGFISCWDEKYRSNVIRPETYINQYMSTAWTPMLQTPPFPEYTSGHSVISATSALILTDLFGKNFSFADSTEVEFGIPVRRFTSFIQAAEEAAISRLYGGIHYKLSIENGMLEGKQIGAFVVKRLKTRRNSSL